jgi:hypothetical protein
MGIFDMFLSEEKRIAKQQRTITNRDAQPEDREAAARWLAENGSAKSVVGLLTRFDMKLENQLKDAGERDFVYSLVVGLGDALDRPLARHLERCQNLAHPLKLLVETKGEQAAIERVFELLQREHEKDDFKPRRKTDLLVWLAQHTHEGAVAASRPFLEDFDENVRYAAIEVIAAQNPDDMAAILEPVLTRPEEDANRVKVRIAELFLQRGLAFSDVEAVRQALPGSFVVADDGRIKSA